jgi:hypothetical protein
VYYCSNTRTTDGRGGRQVEGTHSDGVGRQPSRAKSQATSARPPGPRPMWPRRWRYHVPFTRRRIHMTLHFQIIIRFFDILVCSDSKCFLGCSCPRMTCRVAVYSSTRLFIPCEAPPSMHCALARTPEMAEQAPAPLHVAILGAGPIGLEQP